MRCGKARWRHRTTAVNHVNCCILASMTSEELGAFVMQDAFIFYLRLMQMDTSFSCNSFTGTTCQKTEDWKTETEDDWNLLGIQWQISFILTFACLLALGLHLSSSTSCLIPFIVPPMACVTYYITWMTSLLLENLLQQIAQITCKQCSLCTIKSMLLSKHQTLKVH